MSDEVSNTPQQPQMVYGISEKIASTMITSAVALVAAAVSAFVTYQATKVQNRLVDADFTRIALSILAEEFDPDKPEYAREFAVKMLEQSSGIPISDSERVAWVRDGNVIGSGWIMNSGVCQPAISLPSGLMNVEESLRILNASDDRTVFVPGRSE